MEREALLLELLKEASKNMRSYIDLRYKHFTSFLALNTIIGTATFMRQQENLPVFYLAVLGIIVSILFWLMDLRTSQQYHIELSRVKQLELILKSPEREKLSMRKLPKAGYITSLIFFVSLVSWVGITIFLHNTNTQLNISQPQTIKQPTMQPLDITELVILIFTGVIAALTVAYTIYLAKLWRATIASVDIARYMAFMNLLAQLSNYAEDAKRRGLPEAVFLEQFGTILAEFGFEKFLDEIDLSKNKDALQYFSKIEGMLRVYNIDPSSVSWFRPILKKLGK